MVAGTVRNLNNLLRTESFKIHTTNARCVIAGIKGVGKAIAEKIQDFSYERYDKKGTIIYSDKNDFETILKLKR